MNDEVWKDFFTDHQTTRVMNSSEVWRNYSQAELARERLREKRALEEKLDRENQILSEQFSEFQKCYQEVCNNSMCFSFSYRRLLLIYFR